MDLGLALVLMNGAWPDLEMLSVQERPLSRQTVEFSLKLVVPPEFVAIDGEVLSALWSSSVLRSQP